MSRINFLTVRSDFVSFAQQAELPLYRRQAVVRLATDAIEAGKVDRAKDEDVTLLTGIVIRRAESSPTYLEILQYTADAAASLFITPQTASRIEDFAKRVLQ